MKKYIDDYEEDVIKEKILFELQLSLDAYVFRSKRSTTQIFDLLSDLGGFYGSLDALVFLIG